MGMNTGQSTSLERAFQLARSGQYSTTDEIRTVLRAEGYATEQLTGPELLKQLRTLLDESARGLPSARKLR